MQDESGLSIYCVACDVGKERTAAQKLEQLESIRVISPVRVTLERRKGEWFERESPLTPGYLFLFSDEPTAIRVHLIRELRRVLSYGDHVTTLLGADRDFALWLYRYHGRIPISRTVMEGSQVRVVDGPLLDLKGQIVRVDRHKKRALVQVPLANRLIDVWLSFEWLEMNLE